MNQITIKINDKDFIIKQSFRSYLLFEEMTGKQIADIQTLKDFITMLYCYLKGGNKTFEFTFDEFLDLVDEDATIISKFNEFNVKIATPTSEKKRR